MTLEELLEIIKQKRENAQNDLKSQKEKAKIGFAKGYYDKAKELKGEIDAYTDLICLIESKM